MIESAKPHSVLKGGLGLRAQIYRLLPRFPPPVLDGMTLPTIGVLLGNDMVETEPDQDLVDTMRERAMRVADKQRGANG